MSKITLKSERKRLRKIIFTNKESQENVCWKLRLQNCQFEIKTQVRGLNEIQNLERMFQNFNKINKHCKSRI